MGNWCVGFFGGPTRDEFGQLGTIKNVAFLSPGDRICKVSNWREGENKGKGDGEAVVATKEPAPSSGSRMFKLTFEGDEPELTISAAQGYFKCLLEE